MRLPVVAVAIAGAALALYLTANKLFATDLAYCASGSGCELVQESRWSTFLGVPIALWGALTYLAIVVALVVWPRIKTWRAVHLLAMGGTGVSLYLTAAAAFGVGAFCVYCLASLVLMLTVLVLSSMASASRAQSWGIWNRGGLVAAVAVAVLTIANSSLLDPRGGSEDPFLAGLADHLRDTGAIFYGAYWCPHCVEQKDEFGAAARRLPYVECSPNGPRQPQSAACNRASIQRYPTWVIAGNRIEGGLTVEELARFSDYRPAAGGR